MTGETDDNPRNVIRGSSIERTMNYMEIIEAEVLDERVKGIFLLLGNALPSGTERDVRGASFKQLRYICKLARINDDEGLRDFTGAINRAGGLDSLQAHVIIEGFRGCR